jgi:hypothetical protein
VQLARRVLLLFAPYAAQRRRRCAPSNRRSKRRLSDDDAPSLHTVRPLPRRDRRWASAAPNPAPAVPNVRSGHPPKRGARDSRAHRTRPAHSTPRPPYDQRRATRPSTHETLRPLLLVKPPRAVNGGGDRRHCCRARSGLERRRTRLASSMVRDRRVFCPCHFAPASGRAAMPVATSGACL